MNNFRMTGIYRSYLENIFVFPSNDWPPINRMSNVCVSNKSSVHETFKTAGLAQTGSNWSDPVSNFWNFFLKIFTWDFQNLDPVYIENHRGLLYCPTLWPLFGQVILHKNELHGLIFQLSTWKRHLEMSIGNIWLGNEKHICNLLHIYGLCKIKCICNLRYIFNHSWKWHEYVCLSLYIKTDLALEITHSDRPG